MSKKILVAEDSASMREIIKMTLSSEGYCVTCANDGSAALDIAKSDDFNLVISDLNMPIMNGITLSRELRALPKYKHVPILMLTTETDEKKKMEGKAAGIRAWLTKPFKPELLNSALRKLL